MKIFDRKAHQQEVKEALQEGNTGKILLAFFFPKVTRKFLLRLSIVIFVAYIFFRFVWRPGYIMGRSMYPTYSQKSFNFCWRGAYLFREPARGDIVMAQFGSKKVMLLKRIVAIGGDTVEFRKGKLFLNGKEVKEDYVVLPCSWEMPPRKVSENSFYIIGDNRSMDIHKHMFGAVHRRYILGTPVW